MTRKKHFRLPMKTVRELIKQELGLNLKPEKKLEGTGIGADIYVAHIGNFELTISNDWYERNGAISFCLSRDSGTVQLFFDPETLEEDWDAEDKYAREIRRERCRACREITVV